MNDECNAEEKREKRRRNHQGRIGGGDEEVTGDEGVGGDEEVTGDEGGEPGDMLGEEIGEDGGCKSTRGGEAEGVERLGIHY